MEDIKGINFKMVSLYLLPENVLGVRYRTKTRLTLLDLIFCRGGHQIGLHNHTPAQCAQEAAEMYGQLLCVCVSAMHAKIIVSKSLMTEEVKNSLFLVLLAVQDFSTPEHIFFQKASLFNLCCTCA